MAADISIFKASFKFYKIKKHAEFSEFFTE